MPTSASQTDLEVVIQSEVSQTERGKYHMRPLIWGIWKKNDTNGLIHETEIDS